MLSIIDLILDLSEKDLELVFGHLDGEYGSSSLEVLFLFWKDGWEIYWLELLKVDIPRVWSKLLQNREQSLIMILS